ncbi:MAG: hypothetical protein HQK59_03290 [Deltaproteobacteria bacterium]|nr:hypothetical protein [Deltaproteobacteria bacterium]
MEDSTSHKDNDLARRLQAVAVNDRIGCHQTFKVAEEMGVSLAEAGRVLNELGIKIVACQLGCF